MKVYYFTVIAIGLMFLMYLGNIETTSSLIINTLTGTDVGDWSSGKLWVTAIIAFGAFVAATALRINAGFVTYQSTTESIMAGVVTAIYVIFAADMYSIVSKVASIYDCTSLISCSSWVYYAVWALIIPIMGGYAIALIEFIRGTD